MYGPRVIVSMSIVLVVFAGATYFLHGSAFATLWQTILCAVLLQAGYFVCILFLVSRERAARARKAAESGNVAHSGETGLSGDMGTAAPHLKVSDR